MALHVGQDIIWANFLKAGAEEKPYEESMSYQKLGKIMEDFNDDYNLTYPTQMNLVFFKDCMQQMGRAARGFGQPRGERGGWGCGCGVVVVVVVTKFPLRWQEIRAVVIGRSA